MNFPALSIVDYLLVVKVLKKMPLDYFDILPIHPQPKHLESLSSYITRLAETNDVVSTSGLLSLLSLERANTISGGVFTDLPPVSFGALSNVAVCSNDKLLRTTFYHLIRKFYRPPLPQPASRFLAASVAQKLRYCPVCLVEFGCYSLCWRFSVLTGCIYHSCHLLEKCGHCRQMIPLFAWPPKLGICSRCNGDLRICQATLLSAVEQRNVSEQHQELEFLLSPHPCDMKGDKVLQFIGQQLACLRQARHESRLDVARTIGEPLYRLANVESGDILRRGVTFQTYVKYAQYLQTTLSSLASIGSYEDDVTASGESSSNRVTSLIVTVDEDELLEKVREAVESIKRCGKPVTKTSVARILQTYPRALCRFDSIEEFLEQAIEHPIRYSGNCVEQELLSKVKLAVDHLKSEGSPPTQRAVARVASIDQVELRRCSSARAIIDRAAEEYRAVQLELREDKLINRMREALHTLNSKGEAVTRTAVSKEIHVGLNALKRYPIAWAFLDQLVPTLNEKRTRGEEGELSNPVQGETHNKRIQQFQQREEDLIRQISVAIEDLLTRNERVTQNAVARFLQVTSGALKYYPRVRVHLEQVVKDAQEKQFNRREEELLIQIESAVQQLEAQRKSVTAGSISEMIHMSVNSLRYYPKAWAAVKQILSERAERRVQSREERLAILVNSSLQILRSSGEQVNYRTVSELMGLSVKILKRRNQLREIIEEAQ